ncbi:hypothetical protein D1AOALGA4SA_319 [Olavius algarvensis Delta 1 endosymbiont]|nr:hypothetical protein D1AOALGA4SA_319 [Olavius algarvensis Delta 1 endosymbiont]
MRIFTFMRPLYSFYHRSDWTLAARGRTRVKLHENLKANRRISNKKYRMMKCGIASL